MEDTKNFVIPPKIQELSAYWREKIRQSGELVYPYQDRLGDHLITYSVYSQVATKLSVSIRMAEKKESTAQSDLLKEIGKTNERLPIQQLILNDLSRVLGIDFGDIDVNRPLPLQTVVTDDFTIDAERIRIEGKRLSIEVSKPIILMYQAGSIATKRFSIDAIRGASELIKSIKPESYIVVATDGVYFPTVPQISENDGMPFVDRVVMRPDLNELGALAYASQITLGTDTGWGWHITSCFADARNGNILPDECFILYTVADPKVWGIPNATNVVSKCLSNILIRNEDALVDGLLPQSSQKPSLYTMFNNFNEELAGIDTPIHESDINAYLKKVYEVLNSIT